MQQDNQTKAENALIALFVWAEAAILAGFASILKRTSMLPIGLRELTVTGMVHRLTQSVTVHLNAEAPALIDQVVQAAAEAGAPAVSVPPASVPPGLPPVEPRMPGGPLEPPMSHAERAAEAIRHDLTSELDDVRFRITRLDDDVYKLVAPHHAIGQVLGQTPQAAQAAAWRDFVSKGVTGFTDKGGRDWQLSSYVEMAVRTASMRAFNAARTAEIQSMGGNLVFVSDDGHPCPLCLPWQNVVLCIVDDGRHPTVAQATEAGLFHPNCKHALAQYLPGVTKLPAPQSWTPELDAAYKATQKQRAAERRIRAAKRDAAYATTPEARQAAMQDVRRAQAKLRDLLKENPQQLRRPRREQPNLSMR